MYVQRVQRHGRRNVPLWSVYKGEMKMIKRTIRETVREYDADGKVVKQTVTETTEEDDTVYYPTYNPFLYTSPSISPSTEPTCSYDTNSEKQ